MITEQHLTNTLDEYIEHFVPAMLRAGYHLKLVKGGPDYPHLPEQSHFAHITNGIFGLAQFLKFFIAKGIVVPGLDEDALRKVFALFTVHEVHKDERVELLGSSEFSIPLDRLREEYERLGLDKFAQVDEHLLRAANVHKRSSKHGDLLLSNDPQASRLWLLVRIADTFASVKTPAEAVESLRGYLADLSPLFAPQTPPGKYALYYHELKDVRGVLTNAIHQAVAREMEAHHSFYPLLYFATGTLYVGLAIPKATRGKFTLSDVAETVVRSLVEQGSGSADAIRDAIRPAYFDFEEFVYSFSSTRDLLGLVRDDCLAIAKPNTKDIEKDFESLLSKRDLPAGWTAQTAWSRLRMQQDDPKAFLEQLVRARRYLFYADKLLRALVPTENALRWFLRTFTVPDEVAMALDEIGDLWAKGGPGKYVLPIAYHFLRGSSFADRPAEALPPTEVLERLHQHVLVAMSQLDTQAGRQAAVTKLGLRQELESYLAEHLYVSFAPTSQLEEDGYVSYVTAKRKGHTGKICSLCNRHSDFTQELRTGILDDFGRVFSNRVLPAPEAPQGNRLWCPICQLEFVLRKVLGMGLPGSAHYKNSRRIYLYVLPTFSFTPEHLRLFEPLLRPFHRVTSLPVRDYGRDWGLPHHWLERRECDPEWVTALLDVLEHQATRQVDQAGWSYGEQISVPRIQGQPHYYLITWEKYASKDEKEDVRIATHTEAWAKALFASAVISGLTSCKVYVTERPYLPVTDPAELKATITLDSPPPALRGLLGTRTDEVTLYGRERGRRSGLEQALDVSAALWVVTADVHKEDRGTKDKHISGRLEKLNTSPLAGATFYKDFGRLNEGQSPHPTLTKACEVLLETQADLHGGELMDLVEKIAQKSLEIALPIPPPPPGRGKARRYELVFREGVSAMRKAQQMIPEMRAVALGERAPEAQSVAELKRLTAGTLLKGLERRQGSSRGETFVRAWGERLGRLVGEFIDILVDELYLGRAGGSFARFLRLENALADGIYYYTDRNLSRLWEEHKQQKAAHPQTDQED